MTAPDLATLLDDLVDYCSAATFGYPDEAPCGQCTPCQAAAALRTQEAALADANDELEVAADECEQYRQMASAARVEVERLREALAFYANPIKWTRRRFSKYSDADEDCGAAARAALKGGHDG